MGKAWWAWGAVVAVLASGLALASWALVGTTAPVQASSPGPGPADLAPDAPAAGGGDEDTRASVPAAARGADPYARLLSPLTREVVDHLREVVAQVDGRKDDVFAKIGDSATVNRAFMQCFATDEGVDLGAWTALGPTVEFFRRGQAGRRDPYRRQSLAAKVGWSSRQVVAGRPSPLLREVRAISPRFALVMLGTNELERQNLRRYALRMLEIVDALTSRGVIPVLYTLPPRNDDPEADKLVPRYNLVIEAVARARRVPWVDFHAGMLPLPNRGIASDNLHPGAPVRGGHVRGCDLSATGLRFGQNLRNLLTLRMLHRLRELVLEGKGSPDAPRRAVTGRGTAGAPFQVPALPFSTLVSTEQARSSIDRYPGCDAQQDESGPEQLFRFRLKAARTVRATVLYGDGVDVDVHLLGDRPVGDSCLARGDRALRMDVPGGTYHVAVDTFAGAGRGGPGPYLLLLDFPPDDDASDDEG